VIPLNTPETHVDLSKSRQAQCDRTGESWPTLEACLECYDYPIPETVWKEKELTNTRFGEELGPAYLEALENGGAGDFVEVIDHYLRTDLEANFAVFYADIGKQFTPSQLDSDQTF